MPVTSAMSRVPQRWIVCALCSLALAIISSKNTCFYAIADIVDSVTKELDTPINEGCPFMFSDRNWGQRKLPLSLPLVFWNPRIVNIVDTTFHAGKFLSVIPAGVLSDVGYSKCVLGGGMLLVAATHLLRPTIAQSGIIVNALTHFLEGVGEASVYPSIISLVSRWSPSSERNCFTALVVAGFYYGDILGHIFFKLIYLGSSSWSLGQYVTGLLGLVWSVFCFIFLYHSPEDSPFISHSEVRAITSSRRRSYLQTRIHRLQGIPWRKIIYSRPFLILVLVFCSLDWATGFNIYGNLQYYQLYILHLPEQFCNGSIIIVDACLPTLLIGGLLADWIIKHSVMTKTAIKRTFVFISVFSSSFLLVSACFVGCNVILFWVLSVTAVYIIGLAVPAIYSSPVDLSTRHAGLLMGVMTGASTVCSFFDDRIEHLLVSDNYNPTHWRIRSVICALLSLVLMMPFLICGSVEKQRWRSHSGSTHSDERPHTELQNMGEPGATPS